MSNSTAYQNNVNSLSGALGPTNGAYWPDTMSTAGNPYSLSAQPLYYSPVYGKYITSYISPASQGSINFSYGKKKRKIKNSKRKSRKSRKSRKNKKTKKNLRSKF